MDGMVRHVVDQTFVELPQQELVELKEAELSQVGAGIFEPGLVDFDK
jgi:hypothetical protein